MADPNNVSQYKYSAMSNLVLQADRRFISRRNDETTGDPESLAGRLNIRDMGSRVGREDALKQKKTTTSLQGIDRGSIREGEDVLEREQRKRKRGEPAQTRGAGILSAGDALIEGLKYRPRTPCHPRHLRFAAHRDRDCARRRLARNRTQRRRCRSRISQGRKYEGS